MIIQKTQQQPSRHAFTLMEMLVVVAIIVMLAGVGGYYYMGQLEKSKAKIAVSQAKKVLTTACQTYYTDNETWPPSLDVLLVPDQYGKPYLETADALKDPWGKPYQYNPAGTHNNGLRPDIWSESPMGQLGNW